MDAINLYTPKRPELWQVSGSNKGVMSTPTITINGNYWDRNQLSLAGMNNKTGIIASLGLKENEVGQKGTMPSIGESGQADLADDRRMTNDPSCPANER